MPDLALVRCFDEVSLEKHCVWLRSSVEERAVNLPASGSLFSLYSSGLINIIVLATIWVPLFFDWILVNINLRFLVIGRVLDGMTEQITCYTIFFTFLCESLIIISKGDNVPS